MVGIGSVSSFLKISFPNFPNSRPSFTVMVLMAAMSAPATKAFSPAPVTMTALVSSRLILSITASRSFNTWTFNAFKASGRLMVITPT